VDCPVITLYIFNLNVQAFIVIEPENGREDNRQTAVYLRARDQSDQAFGRVLTRGSAAAEHERRRGDDQNCAMTTASHFRSPSIYL